MDDMTIFMKKTASEGAMNPAGVDPSWREGPVKPGLLLLAAVISTGATFVALARLYMGKKGSSVRQGAATNRPLVFYEAFADGVASPPRAEAA